MTNNFVDFIPSLQKNLNNAEKNNSLITFNKTPIKL